VKGRLVVLLDVNKLLAPGSLQIKASDAKPEAKAEARGATAR
jgi:hypothetical protein